MAALQRLAAQHRAAIQPILDASLAPQRQRWAELARQISSLNEATRTASEAARAISSIQPQLQVWHQQQEQIAQTIRLMQARPSLRMGFSAQTFDRATELVEQQDNALQDVPADLDATGLEIPDAVVEIPEELVREVVEATEPAAPHSDPARARSMVVAVVATLVFLKIIQWGIEHPEAAGEIVTVGTLAWYPASIAADQAGKLWDKILAAKTPDHAPDSETSD
jgi:hypothetical protein